MPLPSSDAVTVEKVARRVLVDLKFEIEYPSSKEGLIVTGPLVGDSWFEFWREDTVGTYQRVESSFQNIRRTVTVTVTPEPQGSQVTVKVAKDRMSSPNTSPQSVGETYDIFSPSKTDLARYDEFSVTAFRWIPMGRDELLEQRILERIQVALGATPRK
jgi:hypothetical protein